MTYSVPAGPQEIVANYFLPCISQAASTIETFIGQRFRLIAFLVLGATFAILHHVLGKLLLGKLVLAVLSQEPVLINHLWASEKMPEPGKCEFFQIVQLYLNRKISTRRS